LPKLATAGVRPDVPVNTIEPAVGLQEAWALTHEADRLWDNKLSEWVAFAIATQ
jgi:hypothetical protein